MQFQVHCEFCRRGFRSNNDLYKHKTRLHAKEAGLRNGYIAECPHCQRKFTDLGSAYRDKLEMSRFHILLDSNLYKN